MKQFWTHPVALKGIYEYLPRWFISLAHSGDTLSSLILETVYLQIVVYVNSNLARHIHAVLLA